MALPSVSLGILMPVLALFLIQFSRSDTVEGSRLLEEVFRDYEKHVRPNFGGAAVSVNVSIYILSISEVDSSSMTFTMTFFIRQLWNDHRLIFNSKLNIDSITLAGTASERIWTPDTYFVNELSSVKHTALVENQFCRISQTGMVLLSRKVTVTAFAPMSLQLFPYDRQRLTLELESYGSQTKDLEYHWSKDVSSSNKTTPEFFLEGIAVGNSTKTTETGSYSILTIDLVLKRNPISYEIGVMLPAFLLVIASLTAIHIRKPVISMFTNCALILLFAQVLVNFLRRPSCEGMSCFTPLNLYMLFSIGFAFICLICSLKVKPEKRRESGSNTEICRHGESKSRTESTSEDSKLEEIKSDGVTLENRVNPQEGNTKEREKFWSRVSERIGQNSPDGKLRCTECILAVLWTSFIFANVVFFAVFRNLQ